MFHLFLFFIYFLAIIKSGHIDSLGISLNYNNAGYATEFKLTFSLENGLNTFEYIKIIFPFSLHASISNNKPNGVIATYMENLSGYNCGMINIKNAAIYVSSDSETTYYIQIGDNNILKPNLFYTLIIEIVEENANLQSSGVKNPIQMYTVSDLMNANSIIYDSNPVFASFAFNDYPSTEMQVTPYITSPLSQTLDSSYQFSLEIISKRKILNGGRFEIKFSDVGYSFSGFCESISRSTAQIIKKVDSSLYSCYVDSSGRLNFEVKQTIEVNSAFLLNIGIKNPNFVIQDVAIEVKSLLLYINTLIEVQKTDAIFKTLPLTLSSFKLFLAWGLDTSSQKQYPFNLFIHRADDITSPTYFPYNSFNFKFKTSAATFLGLKLRLKLSLSSTHQTSVLSGSILHSLPNINSNSKAYCKLFNPIDPPLMYLQCDNIGQLQENKEYFVGLRISFPNDKWTQPLLGDFGTLSIFSFGKSSTQPDDFPLFSTQKAISNIQTINNPKWIITNPTDLDDTMVSTEAMDASILYPGSYTLGMEVAKTDKKKLVFTLNMPILDVYTTTSALPITHTSIPFGAGLIILTNPLIDYDKTLGTTLQKKGISTGEPTLSFTKMTDHNLVKITCSHTSQLTASFAFNGATPTGANYFSLSNILIPSHTSLYPDSYILDFYIASFEKMDTAFPAFRKVFLYNGYTITSSFTSNIRFGVSSFWNTASEGNAGGVFPSFLRIAGKLDVNELTGTNNKIAIFFNGMDGFPKQSDGQEIDCVKTGGGTSNCIFYGKLGNEEGQSYHNMERIEVEALGGWGSTFELVVPVKTKANVQQINIFLGVLGSNPSAPNFNTILQCFRLTGGANVQTKQITLNFGSTLGSSWAAGGISSISYDLLGTGMMVGQTGKSILISGQHVDASNQINVNSNANDGLNGASFVVVGSESFITDNSVITFASSNADEENKCVGGSYTYMNNGGKRFFIFCPYSGGNDDVSSIVTINNGKMPFSNGNKLPSDTAFLWSDKTGQVKSFVKSSSSVIPTPSVLIFYNVYGAIKKNFKQNNLQFSFRPANPILNGFVLQCDFLSAIQFTFSSGIGSFCELKRASNIKIIHKCQISITGSMTPSISYTISDCVDCPVLVDNLLLNHFGINNPNSDGNPTNFYFRIYSGEGNKVEESTLQTLKYDNTPLVNTILLSDLYFSHLNRRSKGSFKFAINMNGRSIWRNENLVLNLGGVAKDNSNNFQNMQCRLMDSLNKLSRDWLSIDLKDLTAVTIIPRNDINDTNLKMKFSCDGVITPFSYNPNYISLFLQIKGTSTIIKYANGLSINSILDANLFPISNLYIDKKLHNAPGSNLDIFFNITCSNKEINSLTTQILIEFPLYYSPKLTSNLIACQINNILASCEVTSARTLTLSYLPLKIAINQEFQIRVYGLECPSYFISGSKFFIAIFEQTQPLNLTQHGTVADINPDALPMNILIFGLTISNYYIRTYSNYQFSLQLPPGSISSSKILIVDFPKEWDLIINSNPPSSCKLYNPDQSIQFAEKCTNFANRIKVYISKNDITTSFFYDLFLYDIRNPDYQSCDIQPFIVTITNLDETVVYSKSHFNQINKIKTNFIKNPKEINLGFTDEVGSEVIVFQSDIGIFSKFLKIKSDYGVFYETVTFNSQNSFFNLYSSPVKGMFGEESVRFSVSAFKNTLPGLYVVEILKTETFNSHTRLPFLKIRISSNIYDFQLETDSYDLPIGGTTMPIKLFFSNTVPVSDLKIDFKFNVGLPGLSFLNQTSILITPKTPNAILIIQSDAMKSKIGSESITLIKSGGSSDNFNKFPTINLKIIQPIIKEIISISTVLSSNIVTAELSFSCSATSTYYYLSSLNSSLPRSKDYIKQQALLLANYRIDDVYQENFGFLNIFEEDIQKNILLKNLLPDNTYNFTGFCQNLNGVYSESNFLNFRTKGNDGFVWKIIANFSSEMASGVVTKLACFFNRYYKLPARYVKTGNNTSCEDRRLLETTITLGNNTIIANDSNTTKAINVVEQPQDFSYPLFIYPNDNNENDQVKNVITNMKYSNSDIINWIVNNITGMPSIANISAPMIIDRVVPKFLNEEKFTIEPGMNSITFKNISINITGFIYCSIELLDDNLANLISNFTTNNTKYQEFLAFNNISNTTGNNSFVENLNFILLPTMVKSTWVDIRNAKLGQKIHVDGNKTIDIKMSGLANGTFYKMFIYATNEEPSYFSPRTLIFSFIQNTTNYERLILFGFNIDVSYLIIILNIVILI